MSKDPAGAPRRAANAALSERLGHRFRHPALLRQALTHRSAAPTGGGRRRDAAHGYERLEFLGDRVLGVIVAHMLYREFPLEAEGALARRFAELVRRKTLVAVARDIELGRHVVLARGEAAAGGRGSESLLADACEAVIAALFIDGGLAAATAFVERHWRARLELTMLPPSDAKTALQEWAQGAGLPLPVYRTLRSEGPPHEPVFEIEVGVEGHPAAAATGRSKRAAETAAAGLLLQRLAGPSQ